MDLIDEVTDLFSQLCQGMTTKDEKLNYIRSLGFDSFKSIEDLSNDDMFALKVQLRDLVGACVIEVHQMEGYTIHRPAKPRHINEVSWSHPFITKHILDKIH